MTRPKVLIVEDEIIAAANLGMLCERWGYDLCPLVTTAEEAVESAQRERPDIILMDISIHGNMDGVEAAHEIRGLAKMPVIFMSGYSDESIMERARAVEVSGYLIKPLDFKKLRQLMASLLLGRARQ